MSVVTSPYKLALGLATDDRPLGRSMTHGKVRLSFRQKDGATRLKDLYHVPPLKVLFPRPLAGDPITAAISSSSGGLVGGDRLDVAVTVEEGAAAMVTAQAAEKVYRSTGADCLLSVDMDVANGAYLEYLPQETILFENSRLDRCNTVKLSGNAQLMAGEMLVFGRVARGEVLTKGKVREAWQIERDGRLIWADAFHIEGDLAGPLQHPAALGGAKALATLLVAKPGVHEQIETLRDLLPEQEGLRLAMTALPDLLIIRFISKDPALVRAGFGAYWSALRQALVNRPARLPRLWHV